ncbi:hypothetical protein BpHYR1_052937 [Brachionus plicatilis]|uniref:Uncharacterized protein n=1 Tax=Brachionus plicatilis TaxID=10195 RepID=A0A3M7RSE4_BRAPC|nr:hypothetical protein BpHYR1_052937 [Brachionus plicatilis]
MKTEPFSSINIDNKENYSNNGDIISSIIDKRKEIENNQKSHKESTTSNILTIRFLKTPILKQYLTKAGKDCHHLYTMDCYYYTLCFLFSIQFIFRNTSSFQVHGKRVK